jgi:hypothetical protein
MTLQSQLSQASLQASERDQKLASLEGSRSMLEKELAAARAEAKDKVGQGTQFTRAVVQAACVSISACQDRHCR